jgi:hypothetical protein
LADVEGHHSSEKAVQHLIDEHKLDLEPAQTLAIARRSLLQRLLAAQVVVFSETTRLSEVAEELGAEVVDVDTFIEVFGTSPESPTPEPEAAA